MSPAGAAALAETVVAYDAGRIRQVVPRQDTGQPRVADGTAPAAKGSSRLIPL